MSAACPSLLVFALAGSSFVSATSALAGTITATDAGFVTMAGGSAKGDGTIVAPATYNYSVGFELHYSSGFLFSPLAPMDRKNYFVFDLSDIDAPIVSATLMLYAGVYESTDPFEVFELVAPGDPMDALTAASFLLSANATGPSAFDDPGDPTIATAADLYGNIAASPAVLASKMITAADDGMVIPIPLFAPGVDYLNAFLGGPVILGGTVSSVTPPAFPQQPFGLTGPDIPAGDPLTPFLVIEVVPAPATLSLLALAGVAMRGRRRIE